MIEFDGVRFTYDGQRFALDELELEVPKGEFVCILGSNGSGKSTLAKHINALLIPDEGSVTVNGTDTREQGLWYLIRSTAGMVFQNPDDQIVATLVENDVAFGPENLGLEPEELRARVTEGLKSVGLQGFELRETNALSGGQKQRVAIAGVLAMHPEVLIFDEASAMIDPRGRKGLIKVARALHEAGMTIIMVTHFMEEAALADRVVVMKNGRIVKSGTPAEVLTDARELRKLNLSVPFATELSLSLQNQGIEVGTHLTESELEEDLCSLFSKR